MRVLNLYCGVGGNRKFWTDCEVVSVENDPEIADVYKSNFPLDTVVVADAHEYLLNNYSLFDFIWSSPPCPTHGQYRYNVGFLAKGYKAVFPDMKLYEEIIFLKHYFKGKWVVENTKPYYTPLINPSHVLGRHLFWSNFLIHETDVEVAKIRDKNKLSDFRDDFGVTYSKIKNKRQALRNCVNSELGMYILNSAKHAMTETKGETENATENN